jgi:hypothetical protein
VRCNISISRLRRVHRENVFWLLPQIHDTSPAALSLASLIMVKLRSVMHQKLNDASNLLPPQVPNFRKRDLHPDSSELEPVREQRIDNLLLSRPVTFCFLVFSFSRLPT